MKKYFLSLVFIIGFFAVSNAQSYTFIGQRYDWLAGLFRALGLPAGDGPAEFQPGQRQRAGSVYYDSTGEDAGAYVWDGAAWVPFGGVTQSALNDTAAAIRADFPPGPTAGTILSRYMLPYITRDENGFIREISNGNGIGDSISLTGVTALATYGDSYTGGGFAEDVSKIYPIQLRDSLGLTLTNKGVNTSAWYKLTKTIIADNYLSGTRVNLITAMGGLLDVISNKSTSLNKNKVAGLSRTFFANAFLSSVTSFGDAAVTNSGFSDTTVSCQSKSIVLLDSVQVSYAANSTLSFSFTGDNLVIGTFATTTGRKTGKWKIVIDGVNGYISTYWVTYDGSETYANVGPYALTDEAGLTIYPDVVVIRGLTSGAHTAVITSVDNTATYLDYFGVMTSPATAKPVLVSSIPHVDENVYLNYGTVYNKYINYDIDNLNKAIRQSAADFVGYPISMVDMNKFYDPYRMVRRPDNLHPKTIGHNAFYEGFRNAMKFTRLDDIDVYPNIGIESIPVSHVIAISDETTDITTGAAKVTFRMPYAMTVTSVRASVNTTSSSGTPTVDINEGGVSILSTLLTIDVSEKSSTTAAIPAVISDASLADDAEITIDIDVAGTSAKGLKIIINGTRAL